jgi:hypothetical protein
MVGKEATGGDGRLKLGKGEEERFCIVSSGGTVGRSSSDAPARPGSGRQRHPILPGFLRSAHGGLALPCLAGATSAQLIVVEFFSGPWCRSIFDACVVHQGSTPFHPSRPFWGMHAANSMHPTCSLDRWSDAGVAIEHVCIMRLPHSDRIR